MGEMMKSLYVLILYLCTLGSVNDIKNCWYKIQTAEYPVGRIFGEYLAPAESTAAAQTEKTLFQTIPLADPESRPRPKAVSSLFLDGTWCLEKDKGKLEPAALEITGSGYNEKAKSVKNDQIAVIIFETVDYSYLRLIIHNVPYNITAYEQRTETGTFNLRYADRGVEKTLKLTVMDKMSLQAEFDGKTEIWHRIDSAYDWEKANLARVLYDGTCLSNQPYATQKKCTIDAGEFVQIIGRSASRQKIGGMEDYWYKITVPFRYNPKEGCLFAPNGCWIYGACLEAEMLF